MLLQESFGSAIFFAFLYCFLETRPKNHIPYNKSVEKMAFTVNFGCKNVIRKVWNMENRSNYERKRKILEDNIIRLMMEKNLTARALSKKIWMNDWYITRMLNGKIDPSLDTLFNIAEALMVEPAELFAKKED